MPVIDEGEGVADVGRCATGEPLWSYHHGARRRPFVHPVRTPAGHGLTVDAPDDHPWHHALWFTIKFVDGDNFWEEYDAYGVLRHTTFEAIERPGGRAELAGALDWTRPDRSTVAIREQRRLTHVPLDDEAYAIDVDVALAPTADAVLDRTPFTTWGGYGGLAFRGRGDFHDTRIVIAPDGHGGEGDEAAAAAAGEPVARVLGAPAAWLDLSGLVRTPDGGDAEAGVAILDHPTNARHPVPWYGSTRAATYGDEGWSNFLNAAFLWDEPLAVAADAPLRLRYRVVVHDGAWEPEEVAAAYDRWVSEQP